MGHLTHLGERQAIRRELAAMDTGWTVAIGAILTSLGGILATYLTYRARVCKQTADTAQQAAAASFAWDQEVLKEARDLRATLLQEVERWRKETLNLHERMNLQEVDADARLAKLEQERAEDRELIFQLRQENGRLRAELDTAHTERALLIREVNQLKSEMVEVRNGH